MSSLKDPSENSNSEEPAKSSKRRYNSPLRQRQAEETRRRIINAGVELIHQIPNWDWNNLTFRAVSEQAGISERTVYRHFATERKLKDAVMRQLVDDSGIHLEQMQLNEFASAIATVYHFLASVASEPEQEEDPTFASIDHHRRIALLDAVERTTPKWSSEEQENAAALLDLLWNLPPYERLVKTWRFDTDRAIRIVGWLSELIREAIEQDRRPS